MPGFLSSASSCWGCGDCWDCCAHSADSEHSAGHEGVGDAAGSSYQMNPVGVSRQDEQRFQASYGQSGDPQSSHPQSGYPQSSYPQSGGGGPRTNTYYHGNPPVPVRRTSPFDTRREAARHALDDANPRSIHENAEHGGLLYSRQGPEGESNGYTGSYSAGLASTFSPSDPHVRLPPGVRLAGGYHTHGAYSVVDRTGAVRRTDDPNHDTHNSDQFSPSDIEGQTRLALGRGGQGPEERDRWFTDTYGGPPVDNGLRFYLGTPSGNYLEHNPAAPRGQESVVTWRYPSTREWI